MGPTWSASFATHLCFNMSGPCKIIDITHRRTTEVTWVMSLLTYMHMVHLDSKPTYSYMSPVWASTLVTHLSLMAAESCNTIYITRLFNVGCLICNPFLFQSIKPM